MELQENNFNEYFNTNYNELITSTEDMVNYVNVYHKILNKKELSVPTNYCYNALTKTIKYCKNNNLNYTGNYLDNPDRLLMLSVEEYILDLYCKANLELTSYVNNINSKIYSLEKSLRIKFLLKTKLITDQKYFNIINYVLSEDASLNDYLKTCDILYNFEVEKDLPIAFEYYLPSVINVLKALNVYYNSKASNKLTINELYYSVMIKIFDKLKQAQKDVLISKLNEAHIRTLVEYKENVKNLKK